jgi:hypothetical protein
MIFKSQAELMHAFAQWAQAQNIPPPTTTEGRKVLLGRFLGELSTRMQQMMPSPSESIEGGDPTLHIATDGATIQIEDARHSDHYSDFDQLVDERNEAMRQAHGDDLAMNVLHREHRHDQIKQAAPFSTTTPRSSLQGNFGQTITMQAGDNPIEVARYQGEDNSEAVSITVTLGQARLAALRASVLHFPFQARPYAILNWGNNSTAFQAFIDALAGTQFSISATYASLSLAMQPLLSYPGATATPVPMTLTGSLAFKTIERSQPLTYTWYSDTFFTDSPNVPVPPFATAFQWFNDVSGTTVDMGMFDIGNTAVSIAKGLSSDSSTVKKIPIPGNVTTLAPQAFTGSPQHVAIVFDLAL